MTNANSYTVWDKNTDELVILDGTSKECAKAMGITIQSFYSYLCKSKKSVIRWDIIESRKRERKIRRKQIAKLRSQGMKVGCIAKRYGVTVRTIYVNLRKD